MDDLISRSAVINLLRELRIDNVAVNDKRLVEHIEELPTAYNVDKVVEELEQQAEQYKNRGFEYGKVGYSAMADNYYGKECSYLHAIEIVRKGGVEHG